MIVRLRKSILTSPFLTWFSIIGGRISSEKSLQTGHCRSPNSISSTGALGSPRTIPFCGMPVSRRSTAFACSILVSPPLPPPLVLTTIRTRTTARTRKAPPAAVCSTRRRRSGSLLTRARPFLAAGIADQAGCVQQEEDRHQDGAGHAPLADRFDLEDLQVGEEEAVAEAAEGDGKAAQPRQVVGEEGAAKQQRVGDDPEDGDVDPGEVRVGALGDRLAAAAAGEADGRTPARLGDRDVGRDADPPRGEEGDRPPQGPLAGEARRLHRVED